MTSTTASDREVAAWVAPLARAGYTAKGIVYMIIGSVSAAAALQAGGQAADEEAAMVALLRQPFGSLLLGAVALGLVGYVIWRIVQSLLDPENKGTDAGGVTMRLYYAISAVSYSAAVFVAVKLLLGSRDSTGGSSTDDKAQTLLAQPMGRWLLAVVGLAVIGTGIYQFVRAYNASFEDRLDISSLSASTQSWLVRMGRFGLSARGVVFLIIGGFLTVAAYRSEADRAKGLEGALETLERQSFGPILLAVVAIGLFAYGAHQLVKARYREI